MVTAARTETVPYYASSLTRLSEALSTPEETYRAAAELAKTVFPREVATDAVMRLHGLSHAAALRVGDHEFPYAPAFGTEAERIAFECGQLRQAGLEEE